MSARENTNFMPPTRGASGRGSKNQHGGSSTSKWHLDTDFENEGSGFRYQHSKRKRRSTGGTSCKTHNSVVSENITDQNLDSLSSDAKLSLILTKLTTTETQLNSLQQKFDDAFGQGGKLNKLEKSVHSHSYRLTTLEYKSIDIEARSRRNNLLFKGLPEFKGENCTETIKQFIQHRLLIPDVVPMQRAHRLGQYKPGKNRFIIVAFSNFTDTERILGNANKLKHTPYAISRDFPQEIVDARKALWRQYRDLRAENPQNKISIVYPAKLVCNGRVVRDMFPDWNVAMRRRRVQQDNPSRVDRATVSESRDCQHESVYEQSTDCSDPTSDSECEASDARELSSSIADQVMDVDLSLTQPNPPDSQTQPLNASPTSSIQQPRSQPSKLPIQPAVTPSQQEPVSPSILRGSLPATHDPDPPLPHPNMSNQH